MLKQTTGAKQMAKIQWMTIEINGDAAKLPQNGAWCFVDVDSPTDMRASRLILRRKIRFDNGRFYDEKNHAVNPKVIMNWHVPMDEYDMAAMRNTIGPIDGGHQDAEVPAAAMRWPNRLSESHFASA